MGVKISNEDGTMKVIVQLDTKQAENNLKDFSETFNRTIGNLQQSKGIKETLDDMETFAKDIQF
ncbi:hypothetical protein OKW96_08840 [Sphingobacterium sp. KU25419]|nr:hypothetical protein OKW96_08840 [Sphingobacterium sp. KU25419]